jgi:hypothetical protein
VCLEIEDRAGLEEAGVGWRCGAEEFLGGWGWRPGETGEGLEN